MARKFLYFFIVSFLICTSCANRNSGKENQRNETEIQKGDEIVSATCTNKDGITLKQTFNNTHGTCELELNGERIELKQERMASGIKYSNQHYVYTNWHGETRLFKDGELIFSHDD